MNNKEFISHSDRKRLFQKAKEEFGGNTRLIQVQVNYGQKSQKYLEPNERIESVNQASCFKDLSELEYGNITLDEAIEIVSDEKDVFNFPD